MIAVIADDLTGAAELGGIGLRYGLDVEIAMEVEPSSKADLLVISTDTRSVAEKDAILEVTKISQALVAMKPKWMYKKTDSVLRGHVVAETLAQMLVTGQNNALLIPANPSLGRTLKNGHYFLNDVAIHETYFSKDPEFPIRDSHVLSMVRASPTLVQVKTPEEGTSDRGIVIGEVAGQADLAAWTTWVDSKTLIGGASGFFTAVLNTLNLDHKPKATNPQPVSDCRLYVCGTAFGKSAALVKEARNAGKAVSYMPGALIESGEAEALAVNAWAMEIAGQMRAHRQVIIAIDPTSVDSRKANAVWLRTAMAAAVNSVLAQAPIDELIIEGGSTASAVLRAIGVARLAPVQELGPGVVRCRAVEKPMLHITVKPGSYAWANGLWIA